MTEPKLPPLPQAHFLNSEGKGSYVITFEAIERIRREAFEAGRLRGYFEGIQQDAADWKKIANERAAEIVRLNSIQPPAQDAQDAS